jgi:hypothetical protein
MTLRTCSEGQYQPVQAAGGTTAVLHRHTVLLTYRHISNPCDAQPNAALHDYNDFRHPDFNRQEVSYIAITSFMLALMDENNNAALRHSTEEFISNASLSYMM